MTLPRGQVWDLLRVGVKDDGSVIWDVEEDQVEGNKVDHHPQKDHRGPSEATVLA